MEQPLQPWGCCNLGSINMTKMIDYDGCTEPDTVINWNKLEETVRNAVHFLDNIISLGKYPLPQIKEQVDKYRPIGLGIMGFADMLYMLEIPYNSQEARDLATELMYFINDVAHDESEKINTNVSCRPHNATLTSLAPTGTLSMIAECSAGIEPNFALAYEKHVMDKDFTYVNPIFAKAIEHKTDSKALLEIATITGSIESMVPIYPELKSIFVTAQDISPTDHVLMQAAFQKYCDTGISKTINLPQEATEDDILSAILLAHENKCKGLTVYRDGSRGNILTAGVKDKQKNDLSICKTCKYSLGIDNKPIHSTCNLCKDNNKFEPTVITEQVEPTYTDSFDEQTIPSDAPDVNADIIQATQLPKPPTEEEFKQYMDTHKKRTDIDGYEKIDKPMQSIIEKHIKLVRPNEIPGITYKLPTNESTMFITVNYRDDDPIELFTTIGKAGGKSGAWTEAISRLISLALQNDIEVQDITDQLVGIKSDTPFYHDGVPYLSIPDAIGKTIIKSHKNKLSSSNKITSDDEHDIINSSMSLIIDPPDENFEDNEEGIDESFISAIEELVGDMPDEQYQTGLTCPECNGRLIMQEGCMTCTCGYSKCN